MKIRICPKTNADVSFLLEDSAQELIPIYGFDPLPSKDI